MSKLYIKVCDRFGGELKRAFFEVCPGIGEYVSIEDGYYTEPVVKVIHSEYDLEVWLDCVREEDCESD
jgi:hypothetical protein